ncbi:MAG: V-type ATP synthase subunit E family protein [Candidatus Micrarchaeia archaeon]|jgi:vacuolar-type H+-ATPase subunit E/Vma4
MGLNEIIRDLEKDARSEASAIIADANKQAEAIIRKARADASQIEKDAAARAEEDAKRSIHSVSLAKIDAVRIIAAAEREVFSQVAKKVREKLYSQAKDRKAYEKYVASAVRQGGLMIREGFVVCANRRDQAIAKKYGPLSKTVLDCEGGVVVTSPDGLVRSDSTFEAVFASHEQDVAVWARHYLKR